MNKFAPGDTVVLLGPEAFEFSIGTIIKPDYGPVKDYDWLVWVDYENGSIPCWNEELQLLIF